MTEKFMIDEKYIANEAASYMRRIEAMIEVIKEMADKKQDIFDRYMSFHQMKMTFAVIDRMIPIYQRGMCVGHNLLHSVLQTNEAKKCGWETIRIERDDFFCGKDGEESKQDYSIKDLEKAASDMTALLKRLATEIND